MVAGRRNLAAVALTLLAASAAACNTPSTETGGAPSTEQTEGQPCAAGNERSCEAAVGDLLDVTLNQLHPTQPSLGYDEVYYRLGRYTMGPDPANQLLNAWCATNGQEGLQSAGPDASLADPASFTCEVPLGSETPETIGKMKTAVVGPGGQLYLTDGHHTLTSFWEVPGGGPDTHVRLKITGNLSDLTPEAFWQEMQSQGWTWLEDADGKPVTPEQLPTRLGLKEFGNDRYRSVLYFARDVGFSQDDNSPAFQEFYWGQWLRSQTDPSLQLDNFNLDEMASYLTLVGNVAKAIVALPEDAEIANSRDAAQLGKLDSFGEKAFDALSEPIDSPKPGKLTYSIAYKTR